MAVGLKNLSEAVRAALAGASFSLPVSVQRTYNPGPELEDAGDARVLYVAGKGHASKLLALDPEGLAHPVEHKLTVHVVLIYKPDPATFADPGSIDPLVDLMEEIAAWCLGRLIGGVFCEEAEFATGDRLFDLDTLDQSRTFASILELTFGERD
jgi:hypothetical protein